MTLLLFAPIVLQVFGTLFVWFDTERISAAIRPRHIINTDDPKWKKWHYDKSKLGFFLLLIGILLQTAYLALTYRRGTTPVTESPMIPGSGVLGTILGTILGAILAISGGFAEKAYARRKQLQSLRAALRAEIQAILAIVERRDYIPGLSAFVDAIRAGAPNFFEVRIGRRYDIVFRSNCDKLGLLSSETAARTVRFYFQASSVVLDLNLLRDAVDSPGLQTRYGLNQRDRNLAFHEEILRLSHETIELGNDLIQKLANRAP